LASGAPVAMHFHGGEPRGFDGFVWDIHGTDGDLRMSGPTGHTQIVALTIEGARGEECALRPIAVPDDEVELTDNVPGNVARVYRRLAHDLRHGTRTAPTFDDAVALHRVLAAIEQAAHEGRQVAVDAPNRVLMQAAAK
jgi:predicted dehydrogenase